jgi:hypothetical protein
MSTLAETAVHAIQRTLDGDAWICVGEVTLARGNKLGEALARTIVAPSCLTTVGANLERAIESAVAWLAPAGPMKTESIVRTIIQTNRGTAIGSRQLSRALAHTIDTDTSTSTPSCARLDGAIWSGEPVLADTRAINALASWLAVIFARLHAAVNTRGSTRAVARTVVAIAAVRALVHARLE